PGACPAELDGILQPSALAYLVTYSLEVDDEGVSGDTDGDDQTGHTGQGQPVPDQLGERGDGPVGERPGHGKAQQGDDRQPAVLHDRVDHHESQTDETSEDPALQLLGAQRRGDLLLA